MTVTQSRLRRAEKSGNNAQEATVMRDYFEAVKTFSAADLERRVTASAGSKAKLVVTDVANRPKLKDVPDCPDILTVGDVFAEAIASQSTDFAPVMLKGSEPFVVLITSGTTGKPKGVRYPLALLLPVASYMLDAIELRLD